MAHTQKPDLVFRRKGRDHLNRRGASVQSTTGSRVVRISGSNVGYTKFRGSVKGTGYPFHSPVSPSLSLYASLCAITFQLESTYETALLYCNVHIFQLIDSEERRGSFIWRVRMYQDHKQSNSGRHLAHLQLTQFQICALLGCYSEYSGNYL
jgi:hypothetical protein